MTKKFLIKILIISAAVLSAVFVVCNSSVSGKKSYAVTSVVSEKVAEITVGGFEEMPENARKREVKRIDAIVRGLAHAAEFAVFGFVLIFILRYVFGIKKRLCVFLIGVSLCAAFAVIDEVYQIYIPGRIFDLVDAAEDFLGAIAGCLFASVAIKIREIKKEKDKT